MIARRARPQRPEVKWVHAKPQRRKGDWETSIMKWEQKGKGDAQYAKYAQHDAEYARDYAQICKIMHVMHTHNVQTGAPSQNGGFWPG